MLFRSCLLVFETVGDYSIPKKIIPIKQDLGGIYLKEKEKWSFVGRELRYLIFYIRKYYAFNYSYSYEPYINILMFKNQQECDNYLMIEELSK